MDHTFHSDRITYMVRGPEIAPQVCEFYRKNYDFLKNTESLRQKSMYNEDSIRASLSAEYRLLLQKKAIRFWLFHRQMPDIVLGTVSFSHIMPGPYMRCYIGYKIDKDFLRMGYATEALSVTIPAVQKEYSLHRMEAFVQPSNIPSIRLMEHMGFSQEGYLKEAIFINDTWMDHLLYARNF